VFYMNIENQNEFEYIGYKFIKNQNNNHYWQIYNNNLY
jgi:hypothetical protein